MTFPFWVSSVGFLASLWGIITASPNERFRALFYVGTASMFIILYGYT
jgi:hypothetical protein